MSWGASNISGNIRLVELLESLMPSTVHSVGINVYLFVLITFVGALYSVYVRLHQTLCIVVESLSLFPI